MENTKRLFKKKFATIVVVVLLIIAISVGVTLLTAEKRSGILQNPLARYFLHFYRSVRKIPDLIFSPYFLQKTNLPVYDLKIKREDLTELHRALPKDPLSGRLLADNRVEVSADFAANDFQGRVKARYRGYGTDHWNANKKSWRVNFKDENTFRGIKALNLVIPSDRQYYVTPLFNYRAKKLGLDLPDFSFVRLRLNGQDAGVYLAYESLSRMWLSHSPDLPEGSNVLAVDETRLAADAQEGPYLTPEALAIWQSMTEKTNPDQQGKYFSELAALMEMINNTDDETFKKLVPNLIDLPKFYGWNILQILAGSNHQSDNYNLILAFNTATGKFQIVPMDIELHDQNQYPYNDVDMLLSKRILSVAEFKEVRNEMLKQYLTEDNLKDDLLFYDNLHHKLKKEFLGDYVGIDSGLDFLAKVKLFRSLLVDNFQRAQDILEMKYDFTMKNLPKPKWPEGFSSFPETGWSQDEFLAHNSQFYSLEKGAVAIGPGSFVIKKTVVLPSGLRLVIQPGTSLWLDRGVSIVSYGPLEAHGTAEQQIRIHPLGHNRPWGSILLVDAPGKSIISFADISGGSGININGVAATGMVSAHRSDLEISYSTFSNSNEDDAVNIKYAVSQIHHSKFSNTFSDAIDIDSAKSGSSLSDNIFLEPIGRGLEASGGDAVDISFSDNIEISRNQILGGCGDKGISVGESSRPLIKDNLIKGCPIGVAVKDGSRARIFHNRFVDNEVAISAYRKKPQFSGDSFGVVIAPVFENNNQDVKTANGSEIKILSPAKP